MKFQPIYELAVNCLFWKITSKKSSLPGDASVILKTMLAHTLHQILYTAVLSFSMNGLHKDCSVYFLYWNVIFSPVFILTQLKQTLATRAWQPKSNSCANAQKNDRQSFIKRDVRCIRQSEYTLSPPLPNRHYWLARSSRVQQRAMPYRIILQVV